MSVSDPSGRTWLISRRLFHRPRRRRGRGASASDVVDGLNFDLFADGLAGLVIGIAILIGFLAIIEFWPLIIFVIELVVVAAIGGVHALLGRRIVVAESDGEAWSWTVKGQPASLRLAAQVARAVREGTAFPPGGRFVRTDSS